MCLTPERASTSKEELLMPSFYAHIPHAFEFLLDESKGGFVSRCLTDARPS